MDVSIFLDMAKFALLIILAVFLVMKAVYNPKNWKQHLAFGAGIVCLGIFLFFNFSKKEGPHTPIQNNGQFKTTEEAPVEKIPEKQPDMYLKRVNDPSPKKEVDEANDYINQVLKRAEKGQ